MHILLFTLWGSSDRQGELACFLCHIPFLLLYALQNAFSFILPKNQKFEISYALQTSKKYKVTLYMPPDAQEDQHFQRLFFYLCHMDKQHP